MKLEVNGVHVAIGNKAIVRDVSLRVAQKQFVGLIGANGCGKSTLLKSLYKSLKPQTGTVRLNDLDVLKAPARQVSRSMGVVGQFNEVSFDLTVFQMVLLGRTPHKRLLEPDTQQDIDIVNQALAATHLTDYASRSFLTLSGGEKQRVVLARALAQQPRLLVLDEPTNHLDIRYQLEILSCVKALGISVLAALHDLSLAAQYCDYLYALRDGTVVAHGTPAELLTEPLIKSVFDVNCRVYRNPVTNGLGFAYQL